VIEGIKSNFHPRSPSQSRTIGSRRVRWS